MDEHAPPDLAPAGPDPVTLFGALGVLAALAGLASISVWVALPMAAAVACVTLQRSGALRPLVVAAVHAWALGLGLVMGASVGGAVAMGLGGMAVFVTGAEGGTELGIFAAAPLLPAIAFWKLRRDLDWPLLSAGLISGALAVSGAVAWAALATWPRW